MKYINPKLTLIVTNISYSFVYDKFYLGDELVLHLSEMKLLALNIKRGSMIWSIDNIVDELQDVKDTDMFKFIKHYLKYHAGINIMIYDDIDVVLLFGKKNNFKISGENKFVDDLLTYLKK